MTKTSSRNHVLIDTNILAYVFVPETTTTEYQLRAQLTRKLLAHPGITIVVYEEQFYEVRRAIDDITIRGRIRTTTKLQSIDAIYRDFENLIRSLEASGRAVIVRRTGDIVRRAALLYTIAEQRMGRSRLRKMRRISVDLKIIAAAEKHFAAILARDKGMYTIYRDVPHERTSITPLYYLVFAENNAYYRVCGNIIDSLERILDEVCSLIGLRRTPSSSECEQVEKTTSNTAKDESRVLR